MIRFRFSVALSLLLLASCGHPPASEETSKAQPPPPAERRELVPQLSPGTANDGGAAAALAMVLAYHGHPVPQETLRKELWGPDGTTDALKIVQSARAHGLKAKGVRVPRELLDQVPAGSMVHRKDKQFQVLEEVAGDRVTVIDPFKGRRTLPIDNFWADFSGVALLFE